LEDTTIGRYYNWKILQLEDTTITPVPEVYNTLIGWSTPTTSNTLKTDEVNNKTGEVEPIGGIK
jgi:hypothetical protein